MSPRMWKGKARADSQIEGAGGAEGIVLPLKVTGTGVYDISYTIEITVGQNEQKLPLQVDTGSSDLWITSRSCKSSLCGQTNGHNYDPSGSTSTDLDFSISYLQGNVSGPIVWDTVLIGGYSIENQALAAADSITNEPLSPDFTGVLGLALPLNSIIADNLPPGTSNSPDGAAWPSNLFSITPTPLAPAARFLSLTLSRPGSDALPSLLGIGRHPAAVVPDPAKVRYAALVSERAGTLFWKAAVRAITVYDKGERKEVAIGRGSSGSAFPSAVLDTGVPLIFTTRAVANGIYGAIGVQPGDDGQYYVPCTTPLNLTITLDDRPELPLHPLDLTAEPPKDNTAAFCIGLVQAADRLAQPNNDIGDIILGVPFMRNVYTVMAYAVPDEDGGFPPASGSGAGSNANDGGGGGGGGGSVRPRLGLLGLTDPTTALDEFRRVRVLNQPISSGSAGGSGSGPGSGSTGSSGAGGGRKVSVGIAVLIGLVGFFALCFALFGVRWWVVRRRWRRVGVGGVGAAAGLGVVGERGDGPGREGDRKDGEGYVLADRGGGGGGKGSREGRGSGGGEDDVLRALKYDAYAEQTLVAFGAGGGGADELGYVRQGKGDGEGEDTLVGKKGGEKLGGLQMPVPAPVRDAREYGLRNHDRQARGLGGEDDDDDGSDEDGDVGLGRGARLRSPHQRHPSAAIPLLFPAHQRDSSSTGDSGRGADEFGFGVVSGVGSGRGGADDSERERGFVRGPGVGPRIRGGSMAGVGTAAFRSSVRSAGGETVGSLSVYSVGTGEEVGDGGGAGAGVGGMGGGAGAGAGTGTVEGRPARWARAV